MSEVCEIVEELVTATSSCPATDVIMVQLSSGSSSSSTAGSGMSLPLQTSEGGATSQVTIEAYAILINPAEAESEISHSLVVTGLLSDAARGKSSLFAVFEEMVTAIADAQDEIESANIPAVIVSAAQATSTVDANNIAVFSTSSTAEATSTTSLGLLESLLGTAAASSSVTLLRRVEQSVTSNADGTTSVTGSAVAQNFLLLSSGDGASLVMLQGEHNLLMESNAEASSDLWFKDPGRVAWVLNTETTAGSWYQNFDFESIAQPPGKVLAVGPDGLYELTGATDSGAQVNATVQSGFTDFGDSHTKRVDAVYFGYTSQGRISLTTEVRESGTPPATYLLEQRDATAPRNSRVTPGKGLSGRYWRMTIRNVDGADFEVHDAAVDIAISTRRV